MRQLFLPTSSLYCGGEFDMKESRFDGTLYQPCTVQEADNRLNEALSFTKYSSQSGLLPLSTYQDWVELDWKTPHGSYDSAKRFGDKLFQEEMMTEASPELEAFNPSLYTSNSGDTSNLQGELGDILWLTTALASNGGVDISEAVRKELHAHDEMSLRGGSLVATEVDYVIAKGFNPTFGPLDSYEDNDFEEYSPTINLGAYAVQLRQISMRQYGYDEQMYTDGWIKDLAETDLVKCVGEVVLMVSYYAQKYAKSNFGSVAVGNILKVSKRVEKNLIDKSDGDRSELS